MTYVRTKWEKMELETEDNWISKTYLRMYYILSLTVIVS